MLSRTKNPSAPFEIARRIPISVPIRRVQLRNVVSASKLSVQLMNQLLLPMAVKLAKAWMQRMLSLNRPLPQSADALKRAIRPSCVVRVELDMENVLSTILSRGWLKKVFVQTTTPNVVKVVTKEWVRTQPRFPKAPKVYTSKNLYVKIPRGANPPAEAVKSFHIQGSTPGFAVTSAVSAVVASRPQPTTSLMANPAYVFEAVIAPWLARFLKPNAAKKIPSFAERSFRRMLSDTIRIRHDVPPELLVQALVEQGTIVWNGSNVTYNVTEE